MSICNPYFPGVKIILISYYFIILLPRILQENVCVGVCAGVCNKVVGLKAYIDTQTQVFSFEICEIFMNTYFEQHL